MGDVAANPRGRFDRRSKGHATTPVTVPVERGRIRFLSEVLGETDPIHLDIDAARAAGHPDLVASPSFFMVVEADANAVLRKNSITTMAEIIRADFRYLLHGDERYAYSGLIYAGDELTYSSEVVDFYDRKGGAMEFVTIASTLSHADRGTLVLATRTLLHRLPE